MADSKKITLQRLTFYRPFFVVQSECDAMKNEIKDMEHKAEQTERRNNEMKLSEERKHAEEVAFLKKTNAQLKVTML